MIENSVKRINIQLPSELHRELKMLAASQNATLEAVVNNAVKNIIIKESSNDRH